MTICAETGQDHYFDRPYLRDGSVNFYVLTRDRYQLREINNVGQFKSGFNLWERHIFSDEVERNEQFPEWPACSGLITVMLKDLSDFRLNASKS